MKTLFFISLLSLLITSCGKSKNAVNSGSTTSGTGTTTAIEKAPMADFEGVYDLIRMDSEDCGANIRIVNQCNGYMLLSNHLGPEEFCNVNKGEYVFNSDNNDRNPPNPDRNPPNPDRNPPNPDRNPPNPDRNPPPTTRVQKAVVTQEGNLLRSVITLSQNVSFTNTLTLNNDGTLIKVSNLKSRNSRCVYQKR